eukprot:6214791-Pleurochrysis_carterae.AAC.1
MGEALHGSMERMARRGSLMREGGKLAGRRASAAFNTPEALRDSSSPTHFACIPEAPLQPELGEGVRVDGTESCFRL